MTLTDYAAAQIRSLVAQPEIPDQSGVRIASTEDGALELSLQSVPSTGDTVIMEQGARVFLEPELDEVLGDKQLDAAVDPQGQLQFSLTDR